ncbi:MAG TPA: hypothetical protein DEB09_00195 [Candidatus Magasanikbacteria bacterium]|nr:hypothetical protein [Candidatus Magasanikbacteria bacterium]
MFSDINTIIFILWIFSAISDYSYFVYFFQLKEYRWDRFRDFLSTEQGKHFTFQFNIVHRAFLIMVALFLPLNIEIQKIVILAILAINFIHDIHKIFKRKKFIKPAITLKSLLLISIPILLEVSLLFKSHDWDALLILMMTRIFILGLIVYAFNLMTDLIKKILINRARKKISQYKNLKIIGITGSYGKTTVKIFLDHILKSKFNVISTPKHVNTEIGIAKFILKTNFSNTDIFIVEMGAYAEGEIKLICDMVKPKIGILTAINEQHIALFGNIKKTQKAKYELFRSLPKDGLAITNSDNSYCREFLNELNCQVMTFGTEEEHKPTILVKSIEKNTEGGKVVVICQNVEIQIDSNLRGSHNTMNVLPCTLVARYLGMTEEEIKGVIKNLPQTIHIFKYGNCDIIDDSYNSNPEGFKAALDYITNFENERKRIVITRGMLELGEKSNEIHEKIGGEISYSTDELVIITPDFVKPLTEGSLSQKYRLEIKEIFEPVKLLTYIKNIKNSGSVVLLENRIPELVMKEIRDNSKLI